MNELIWVGNTLIPRGVVVLVMGLVFVTPFVIAGAVQIIRHFKAR